MEVFNKFFVDVLKTKYALFEGRASRQEYWMFILFNVGISLALWILALIIAPLIFILVLYGLATLVPGIAIGVRRLHDVGIPGTYLLIALIPLVGALYVIFMYLIKLGDTGSNAYGAPPAA